MEKPVPHCCLGPADTTEWLNRRHIVGSEGSRTRASDAWNLKKKKKKRPGSGLAFCHVESGA